MAERLTSQWCHTHSCAYMCPVEKMTFEESQCLTVFPEISCRDLVPVSWERLANPAYCSSSDPLSQLQTDPSIITLHLKARGHSLSPLLGSLAMDHSSYTRAHIHFLGWWSWKILLGMGSVMMSLSAHLCVPAPLEGAGMLCAGVGGVTATQNPSSAVLVLPCEKRARDSRPALCHTVALAALTAHQECAQALLDRTTCSERLSVCVLAHAQRHGGYCAQSEMGMSMHSTEPWRDNKNIYEY